MVVNHGVPIDPDYNVIRETVRSQDDFSLASIFGNSDVHHECSASGGSGAQIVDVKRPKTVNSLSSSPMRRRSLTPERVNVEQEIRPQSSGSVLVKPGPSRRRKRPSLFRRRNVVEHSDNVTATENGKEESQEEEVSDSGERKPHQVKFTGEITITEPTPSKKPKQASKTHRQKGILIILSLLQQYIFPNPDL